ncbi:hypothetical protein LguiB_027209 [Lonicera macranthoides]
MVDRNISLDVQTFNVLVDKLCKEGIVKEAHEVLDLMIQRGVEPDTITYNALMDRYCLVVKVDQATKVFKFMDGRVSDLMLPVITS